MAHPVLLTVAFSRTAPALRIVLYYHPGTLSQEDGCPSGGDEVRVVHQNHENARISSEFFEIDQSSTARLGEKKNSSEFFETKITGAPERVISFF